MCEIRISLCGYFVAKRCCCWNKERNPDNELTLSIVDNLALNKSYLGLDVISALIRIV